MQRLYNHQIHETAQVGPKTTDKVNKIHNRAPPPTPPLPLSATNRMIAIHSTILVGTLRSSGTTEQVKRVSAD